MRRELAAFSPAGQKIWPTPTAGTPNLYYSGLGRHNMRGGLRAALLDPPPVLKTAEVPSSSSQGVTIFEPDSGGRQGQLYQPLSSASSSSPLWVEPDAQRRLPLSSQPGRGIRDYNGNILKQMYWHGDLHNQDRRLRGRRAQGAAGTNITEEIQDHEGGMLTSPSSAGCEPMFMTTDGEGQGPLGYEVSPRHVMALSEVMGPISTGDVHQVAANRKGAREGKSESSSRRADVTQIEDEEQEDPTDEEEASGKEPLAPWTGPPFSGRGHKLFVAQGFVNGRAVLQALTYKDYHTLDRAQPITLNLAFQRLANSGRIADIKELLTYMLEHKRDNTHTYASVFVAYGSIGRLDLAIEALNRLWQWKIDIGPVGSSAFIKACATSRNIDLALEVFDAFLKREVSINRWTYNCLIHLCAVVGKLDEALGVYNIMRLEPLENGCHPDMYTYGGLVRAVVVSKNYEMVERVYKNMVEDGVTPDPEVWCHLLVAAGKSSYGDLAETMFRDLVRAGVKTNTWLYNALLSALGRHGRLEAATHFYRRMVSDGLEPDEYTLVALLVANTRGPATLENVNQIREVISKKFEATWNHHLGSTLVNAYRRVATLHPQLARICTRQAEEVMALLEQSRLSCVYSYTYLMALYAEQGDLAAIMEVLRRMEASGVSPGGPTYNIVAHALEESGLAGKAAEYRRQAKVMAGRQNRQIMTAPKILSRWAC